MGYRVKETAPCIYCGTPTNNRKNRSHAPTCLDCSIQAAVDHMHAQVEAKRRRIEREKRAVARQRRAGGSS
jgi:hypothetical protein